MSPTTIQLLYTLESALLMSVVVAGVYLAFRVLRFPDLTSEGGYGLSALLGGLVAARTGSPVASVTIAGLVGLATGAITAVLANVVKLPTILASILTMTMCLSMGLIVVGQPSVTLGDVWLFSRLAPVIGSPVTTGIAGAFLVLTLAGVFLALLLRSGMGFILRARGENPMICQQLRHSLLVWDIVGLALANAIVGVGAMLYAQRSGYAGINMGRGIGIQALAAIMLGETILPSRGFIRALVACVLGAFVMQLVRLLALNLGMPDGSLDLVTSVLVIVFVYMANTKKTNGGSVLEKIRM